MGTEKGLTINQVNALSSEDFITKFGNIVEHGALAAATVSTYRPFNDFEDLSNRFEMSLKQLDQHAKAGVILLYPDLAGKLSQTGGLSEDSKKEHAMIGLDTLTHEEHQKMAEWNAKYKNKFKFPFVLCVRENKKSAILKALEQRFSNSVDTETEIGLGEVVKICKIRLRDVVEDTKLVSSNM